MTTSTSSNHSQAASRNLSEDDRLAESPEQSPNSLVSFEHVDNAAATDLVPATNTNTNSHVETVTEDVDSDAKEAASNLSERDGDLTNDGASSFGGADTFGPHNLDNFLLLAKGTCHAPTLVTARDTLSRVPCVCGCPALDCCRHLTHPISGRFRHPSGLYPWMDAHKGFGGHGKAGGSYYSIKEADAIRQKEKEDLKNLIAGQSTVPEDQFSAVDEPAQDTQVHFWGTTTLGRTPSSGNRSCPLLAEDSLRDTLVSTTRASRTGPKTNPRALILYSLLDVVGKRWVVQHWSTAQDYVMNKGFHYAHVFDSKDEANGWKNFVNAQPSNLKAPPPATNRAKKVIAVDNASSGSSENPEVISKKPGRRRQKNSKHRQHRRPKGSGSFSSSSESHPSSQDSKDSSSATSLSNSSTSGSGRQNRKHQSSRHSRRGSKNHGKNRAGHRIWHHSKQRRQRSPSHLPERTQGRDNRTDFRGPDPLVGDNKRIYGIAIAGRDIHKAMGPAEMRSCDADELFNAGADVTSLPGMFPTNIGTLDNFDEAQRTTEMAATLLSTAIGKPNSDTPWA
jgi:hypothetical protein